VPFHKNQLAYFFASFEWWVKWVRGEGLTLQTKGHEPFVFCVYLLFCKIPTYQWISEKTMKFISHAFIPASNRFFRNSNRTEGVSKSFRTGRLERELQMVQLFATRCSCIAILWVSLVSSATITLCVASRQVFVVYLVIDSVQKLLDTPFEGFISFLDYVFILLLSHCVWIIGGLYSFADNIPIFTIVIRAWSIFDFDQLSLWDFGFLHLPWQLFMSV
jgi:hypothetical protein